MLCTTYCADSNTYLILMYIYSLLAERMYTYKATKPGVARLFDQVFDAVFSSLKGI